MGQFLEFVGNHPLLFTALVVLILMLLMNESRRKLLGFKEIKAAGAVTLINSEDALMLDVRDEKDFGEGHVVNAKNIPLGLLEGRLSELDEHKSKPVIVYCRTGQNSARASTVLKKQGFTSIYKLSGGLMAWQDANMPVDRS
ncbi:rhodanese-like domain-containing protein [Pseudomonadota bacterium]